MRLVHIPVKNSMVLLKTSVSSLGNDSRLIATMRNQLLIKIFQFIDFCLSMILGKSQLIQFHLIAPVKSHYVVLILNIIQN